ncbi:hypothetical protein C5167_014287 [Papaver somniferum]|uniref:FACT complex subunit n=1 Tax=Papaver somniferum TaxID=3469 RepID=A0A4Y7J5W0_PAPSO|nr:FACT complex subunit SPT16-like [Papaver somniferum]RZC55442.1 hypothetical protein C5167_014287 [Papaver somniferum]
MYVEELQKKNQAWLGRMLMRATARKLLGEGQSWTADRSEKNGDHTEGCPSMVKLQKENKEPEIRNSTDKKGKSGVKDSSYLKGDAPPATTPVQLRLEKKKHRKTMLTDLTMLPKLVGGQGGENINGTLEAHVDGFRYTTSRPDFCLDFRYDALESAFFQEGDDRTPPFLHFRLRHSIMVGKEITEDIQFHLVSTPMGQKTSDRNDDLNIFVDKVRHKWRVGVVFQEVEKKHEFHGVLPSKASGVFALTYFSLVGLVGKPFIVVPLKAVELVYLEKVSPREIDMTVVFEDYNHQVFQINSIPLTSVADIKFCLDLGDVKYYENDKKQNWKSIMKGIGRNPQDFVEKGGWEILNANGSGGYEAESLDSSSEVDNDEYD